VFADQRGNLPLRNLLNLSPWWISHLLNSYPMSLCKTQCIITTIMCHSEAMASLFLMYQMVQQVQQVSRTTQLFSY